MLVASTSKAFGANGGTTSAINTLGATFLVFVQGGGYTPFTISDSCSNIWQHCTVRTNFTDSTQLRLSYCVRPIVSASHTFTFSTSASYSSGIVYAFGDVVHRSGTALENGATGSSTSAQAGAVAPVARTLVVIASALGAPLSSPTASDGFSAVDYVQHQVGVNYGSAAAYKIADAGSVNPALSLGVSTTWAATVISFPLGGDGVPGNVGRYGSAGGMSVGGHQWS